MMKGYLTVFLSLSLSVLAGFILMLTEFSASNAKKIQLEYAADTGMNAVLSEFHRGLQERYGLLYIDMSYLSEVPSIANVENRLRYYIQENINQDLEKIQIEDYSTAVCGMGESMRNQAIHFAEDMDFNDPDLNAARSLTETAYLYNHSTMSEWTGLQEQIAGIELPVITNDKNEQEKVTLENPADAVYYMAGSDLLYLLSIPVNEIGSVNINQQDYISFRTIAGNGNCDPLQDEGSRKFLSYLFHQMGYYDHKREGSLLSLQLEYLAAGKSSDWENMNEVIQMLLNLRFAVNKDYMMGNMEMYRQAEELSLTLHAVSLVENLKEPVTRSIMYAWAFLESMNDLNILLNGGTVPLLKTSCSITLEQVLLGDLTRGSALNSREGLSYGQYLAGILLLTDRKIINFRCMDIMEMDIRSLYGNTRFAMDMCMENYSANIMSRARSGKLYVINRKYGYF